MAILAALGGGTPALLSASSPPAVDPDPAPIPDASAPLPPEPERFWLSVELIGPRGAQLDAASSLVEAPLSDALPRGGSPPGEYVGEVTGLADALRWIDAHAFGVAVEGEPEVPGGALLRDHDVILTALVVTRAGPDPYPWPAANVVALPEQLSWQPGSLAVARAPLFAMPAAELPPARERYRDVRLDDAVWLLDERDACSPQPRARAGPRSSFAAAIASSPAGCRARRSCPTTPGSADRKSAASPCAAATETHARAASR